MKGNSKGTQYCCMQLSLITSQVININFVAYATFALTSNNNDVENNKRLEL